MKVKVGNVTKNVPQEYAHGTTLMKPEYFDKPDKLRLSVRERFFFAEAAWRQLLAQTEPLVYNCLLGHTPMTVVTQRNRKSEYRHLIKYTDGWSVVAPWSVVRHAPDKICTEECFDFRV
jgi:hypothetical protein